MKKDKIIIGRLETMSLPDLNITNLHVRVDTGAQTSSLHVDNIKQIKMNGKPAVTFDLHPDSHDVSVVTKCKALIDDIRKVKSSNGISEQRFVIKTTAQLGGLSWPIQISLTDRSDMTYLMLLGREALGDKFYIDPDEVFLASTSHK
ncbi:MAG: ATP-dependent zinc protease family protein [Thalassotalea sp.]